MAYCPDCGGEVSAGARYCESCGYELNGPSDQGPDSMPSDPVKETSPEKSAGDDSMQRDVANWKMAIVGISMGFIIAFFTSWATLNMGSISGWLFLVAWPAGGYFVYQKQSVSDGLGSGLYVTALLLVLTPLLFYAPIAFRGSGDTLGESAFWFGSVLGMVIWGFVFLLFALVVAGLGYYFKRRASRQASTTNETT